MNYNLVALFFLPFQSNVIDSLVHRCINIILGAFFGIDNYTVL